MFCKGDSDYGWSVRVILISQTLVALLASLAISFRLFHGIDFRNPHKYVIDAFDLLKKGNAHRMRIQGLYGPSKLEDVGPKATARRWARNSAGNLAIALTSSMVQVMVIINHSICFIVSIVPFLFRSLQSHYFSRTNRNQGGTISSPNSEEGTISSPSSEEGSWFCCNIEYVVETWLQKGSRRPTTHLLQLLTSYDRNVDPSDPIWLLFKDHVFRGHGSCYLLLAAIVHISRSLFMSRNPSEQRNLATAVNEAKKLLLFVDKWVLPEHYNRKVGITAGKIMWTLMNSSRYAQADAQDMIREDFLNSLQRASQELEQTIRIVSRQLDMRDPSSSSVFSIQVRDVLEGIFCGNRDIPMDEALEWLGEWTMNIVVCCLTGILYKLSPDEPYIMKLQMEDVREAAHVLGMIQALKEPLFPMFEDICSHPFL